jgi:FtsH-binding integral membrane protein
VSAVRLLAVMCLVAALPLAVVKYPWMPATIIETVASYHEPYPDGTALYLAGRRRDFMQWHFATGLYLLGTVSLVGLARIVVGRPSIRAQVEVWILTVVAGLGVAAFERRRIPDMTSAYAVIAFWLPLAIAGLSLAGLAMTLRAGIVEPATRD